MHTRIFFRLFGSSRTLFNSVQLALLLSFFGCTAATSETADEQASLAPKSGTKKPIPFLDNILYGEDLYAGGLPGEERFTATGESVRNLVGTALGIAVDLPPDGRAPAGWVIPPNRSYSVQVVSDDVAATVPVYAKTVRKPSVRAFTVAGVTDTEPKETIVTTVLLWNRILMKPVQTGGSGPVVWQERPNALARMIATVGHEFHGNARFYLVDATDDYLAAEPTLADRCARELHAFQEGIDQLNRFIQDPERLQVLTTHGWLQKYQDTIGEEREGLRSWQDLCAAHTNSSS